MLTIFSDGRTSMITITGMPDNILEGPEMFSYAPNQGMSSPNNLYPGLTVVGGGSVTIVDLQGNTILLQEFICVHLAPGSCSESTVSTIGHF